MTETPSLNDDPEALVVRIEKLTLSVRGALQAKNTEDFKNSLEILRSEIQTYTLWRKHNGFEPENGDVRVETCQKTVIHTIRFQSAS